MIGDTRNTTVIEVEMQGVPKFVADAKASSQALNELKRNAVESNAAIAGSSVMSPEARALWDSMNVAGAAKARGAAGGLETAAVGAAGARGGLFGRFGGAGQVAKLGLGIGAAAGGYAVFNQLKQGIQYANETQRVMALITQGIKSTGGAANVTSEHLRALATRYGDLAGVQRNEVLAGESTLLSFTAIKNELGAGNAVFDRASLAIENVSQRLGINLQTTALNVGKALQDPIKGVSALRQEGVLFTNQQIDQIKIMVASGNRLGSQKIILGQLERQYGGAAKAAGGTLPAALTRLDQAWEDSRQRLVVKTMPDLIKVTNMLARNLPGAIESTLTALSAFDTDPRGNAISRWLHRSAGGGVTGGTFDYLLTHSGKDVASDLGINRSGLDVISSAFGSGDNGPLRGASHRGGSEPEADRGLGAPFQQPPVKVNWSVGDALDSRPVILQADGQQIAKLVTQKQQKRTHAEGRGSAQR